MGKSTSLQNRCQWWALLVSRWCPPDEFSVTGQLWGLIQSMTGKQWTKTASNGDWTLAWKLQNLRYRSYRPLPWLRILLGKSCWFRYSSTWWVGERSRLQAFAAVEEEFGELKHHRRRPWLHDRWSDRGCVNVHWFPRNERFFALPSTQRTKALISSRLRSANSVMYTEHTITILFLVGTVTRLMMRLL